MCLSIAVARPDHVLATGTHRGYQWIVTHNTSGYRCGYLRLPKGHPWHGLGMLDIPVAVHGGITFAEADVECDAPGADDAWWIGFDCAHAGDAPDPSLPNEMPLDLIGCLFSDDVVRTQEYVETECRDLADQAHFAAGGSMED